jgi:hypothetical protein
LIYHKVVTASKRFFEKIPGFVELRFEFLAQKDWIVCGVKSFDYYKISEITDIRIYHNFLRRSKVQISWISVFLTFEAKDKAAGFVELIDLLFVNIDKFSY